MKKRETIIAVRRIFFLRQTSDKILALRGQSMANLSYWALPGVQSILDQCAALFIKADIRVTKHVQ